MDQNLLYHRARQVYSKRRGVMARLYSDDGKWRGIVTCWPEEKQRYYVPITLLLTKPCAKREEACLELDKLLESEECKISSQQS